MACILKFFCNTALGMAFTIPEFFCQIKIYFQIYIDRYIYMAYTLYNSSVMNLKKEASYE